MSNYGMAFSLEIHDAENGFEESTLVSMPSDYLRMRRWFDGQGEPMADELAASLYRNYGVMWYVLQRTGKLGDYGVPETLSLEAIEAMAERYTLFVADLDDDAPLASAPGK